MYEDFKQYKKGRQKTEFSKMGNAETQTALKDYQSQMRSGDGMQEGWKTSWKKHVMCKGE